MKGIYALTILEGALPELSSFLFELLDGTLVDTTALVDQVAGSGGLPGIDVTDDCGWSIPKCDEKRVILLTNDVNVGLLLSHF